MYICFYIYNLKTCRDISESEFLLVTFTWNSVNTFYSPRIPLLPSVLRNSSLILSFVIASLLIILDCSSKT